MTDYATKYPKLSFDYPADRVLRIIFDRPETYNSVDAETHTQMTDIWIDIDRDQRCTLGGQSAAERTRPVDAVQPGVEANLLPRSDIGTQPFGNA